MRVELSVEANADMRRLIQQGLERFGQAQVADYLDGIEGVFRLLSQYPQLGKERAEFARPYRTYAYMAHLIFYRIEADIIYVTRIRHGREDWQED